MVTYIYVNTYKTSSEVYYYVGSHTWDGPEGVIDPDYKGSSCVASNHKMKPTSIRILESFNKNDSRKYEAERLWIERYARRFGIATIACYNKGVFKPNPWQSKFRLGGKLLNGHANTAINAIESARDSEVRKRAVSSRISSGNDNYRELNVIASSSEVRRRAVATAKSNGSMDRMIAAMHSKESRLKAAETFVKSGASVRTSAIALQAMLSKSRHYKVNGFIGTLKECCNHLGLNRNTVANSARGWNSFTYKEYVFEIQC